MYCSSIFEIIKKFKKNEFGGVAVIIPILFLILTSSGIGMNMGRVAVVDQKLQQAIDASTLFLAVQPGSLDEDTRRKLAQRYFTFNFPDNFMGTKLVLDQMEINYFPNPTAPEKVSIKIGADLETEFLTPHSDSLIHINKQSDVLTNGYNKTYVVMVADVSYSMKKIQDCLATNGAYSYCTGVTDFDSYTRRDQLKEIVDKLIFSNIFEAGAVTAASPVRAAIVGYAQTGNTFESPFYDVSNFNNLSSYVAQVDGGGRNGTNGVGAIQIAIDKFNSEPSYQPGDTKIMVLMTDGDNSYGKDDIDPKTGSIGSGDYLKAEDFYAHLNEHPELNTAMMDKCQKAKEEGILLYTISFGRQPVIDQSIQDINDSCSSDPDMVLKAIDIFTLVERSLGTSSANNSHSEEFLRSVKGKSKLKIVK